MEIPFPSSIHDMKVEFGKDMLRSQLALFIDDPEQAEAIVIRAAESNHVEAAEKWVADNPELMEDIRRIVARPAWQSDDLDDLMLMILSEVTGRHGKFVEFIAEGQLRYIPTLILKINQSGEDAWKVLRIVESFALGEE